MIDIIDVTITVAEAHDFSLIVHKFKKKVDCDLANQLPFSEPKDGQKPCNAFNDMSICYKLESSID